MKSSRTATAVVLGVTLLGVGSAQAAAKKPKPVPPVCNLVADPSGDANGVNLNQSPLPTLPTTTAGASTDALDVTSVDVAADKTNLTTVLRLKKLAATSSSAPTGMNWTAQFNVGPTTFYLAAHANYAGALTYDAAYASTAGGNIISGTPVGSFDTAKNEIHISVPVTMLAKQALIKVGTKITAIGATTGPEVLVPDASGVFGGGTFFSDAFNITDAATGGKDYTDGVVSCVTPGK